MLDCMLPMYSYDDLCLQYVNQTGFRTCVKELFVQQHDPLSISYAVMPGRMWKFEILARKIARVNATSKTGRSLK